MNTPTAEKLFERVRACINKGQTAEILAVFDVHPAFTNFLLTRQDQNGDSLLHHAVRLHVLPLTSYLVGLYLQYEIPIDPENNEGQTPLEVAQAVGNRPVADFLRSHMD